MENNSGDKKKQTPSEQQAPKGLCTSCTKAADCTFPRQPGRPVRFCEEFDGESLAATKPRAPKPESDPAAREPGRPDGLRGLCRTCECWETCVYPKPEGGVWHCEEFR